MSNNFDNLASHLKPLLEKLSVSERAQLSKKVGNDLRLSQSKRITLQQNSDGSSYIPRRTRLRDKKGRVRRKMFNKIKQVKYLKNFSNANGLVIGFTGNVQRVARIHQYGLKAKVDRNGPSITYAKRELLGLTEQDIQIIEESCLKHLRN